MNNVFFSSDNTMSNVGIQLRKLGERKKETEKKKERKEPPRISKGNYPVQK